MKNFPEHFLWGAATSAHQVEGNNIYNDWWHWEKIGNTKEVSGQACRHYEYFKEDFTLAKDLHHNCHRLSLEWSRIEPTQNSFSENELKHYQDVINTLKGLNLEPIVTLHHFTSPLWLAELGGWSNPEAVTYFTRYVEKVAFALSDKVKYWITINEPMVYVYHSYILGAWPPQEQSFSKARLVTKNLITAHTNTYRLIHALYKKKDLPAPRVSIAKNIQYFHACDNSLRNRFACFLRDKLYNFDFIHKLADNQALDFIGINYYTRSLVDAKSWRIRNLLLDTCQENHSKLSKNSLGWDIFPEGLYDLLLKLKKFSLPIIITENGICTDDDTLRWEFIREHLSSIHKAMQIGIDVSGYIYWSLIDNYEWDKGFGPRFGLISLDYKSYSRTVRESAKKFAEVCSTNRLSPG